MGFSLADQFANVGDWEPMNRPVMKVTAVIVSISLVGAGLGAVVELVLSAPRDGFGTGR
jgi:hypothetical protein